MSTEFFNDQWRIPSNENQNKVSNYSMQFDGSGNDSITIPSYTIPENSTVSFWVKSSLTNPQDIIISGAAGHYYPYLLLSGGNIRLIIKAGGASNELISDVAWVADTWYHIAITGENGQGAGSTATYYINGVSKGTSLHRAPTLTVIGDYTTSSLAWNGQIDQVCFFDYVLPATGANSIATLYGGGTAVTNPMALSPVPVAYYQLGDQSVSTGTGSDYLVPNNSLQDYVFSFDGTDDYIDLSVSSSSSVPSEQSSWTYSAWLYLDSTHTASFPTIFQRGVAYPGAGMLVRESGGNIFVYYGLNSFGFYNNKLPTNTWSHFALAYDLSTNQLTLYINNLSQTTTMAAGWSILTTEFNIGFRNNNSNYWKGEMSNVQVFNTALPSTGSNSIETIYNNGSPLTSMSGFTSLQSWYKLNAQDTFDGTDWTIKDSAGSNDGTSNGMDSSNLVQSDLQHTSGYSPYALDFDGINDHLKLNNFNDSILFEQTSFTISTWIYLSSVDTLTNNPVLSNLGNVLSRKSYMLRVTNLRNIQFQLFTTLTGASGVILYAGNESFEFDKWEHITITFENEELKCYVNGSQAGSTLTNVQGSVVNSIGEGMIGNRGTAINQFFKGNLSNIAVWRGSVQNPVTLYNSGVPADLTSLNPSAWWQLGSNSSFNPNPTGTEGTWTCLNEGSLANLNAVSSANMTNDQIINGIGYSANGLGTSSIDIIGDAPYSSGNGLSENMDVLDRVEDVPT